MRNFVTPHCHQSSFDSGSTPKAFMARELELGTGYTTVTDHGTLGAAREVYDLAKGKGLTPIIGMEAFFRDDDCPLLKRGGYKKALRYRHAVENSIKDADKWALLGDKEKAEYIPEETFFSYWKYAHLTMHFLDAEAYETAVKLLSAADARAERHGSERKPLFGWKELEELGSKNVVFGSGCLIGMVQRHLLGSGKGFASGNDPRMALWYYQHLKSIVKPGNFIVEAFPHVCDRNWEDKVIIDFQDGTTETFAHWKKLRTNADELKAEDLARVFSNKGNPHETLYGVMESRAWVIREGKAIKSVRRDQGFIPNECRPWCPDGDVQKDCNRLMLDLARIHKDPVMVSDDSHYAHPEEKIVQDVRLNAMGSWRFYGNHHRQSSEESLDYFKSIMGVDEAQFQGWVDNSYAWAERFKGFTFKKRISLPTSFYPQNTKKHAIDLIAKHGRMDWKNQKYVDRLVSELRLLNENGTIDFLPYFFTLEEICDFYTQKGLLTGSGRGSAAGLLFSYLLRITHVDPLKYGLSQERFLTLDRIKGGKLPDIDQDLQKHQRYLLTDPLNGFLKDRFGDCYAQISIDTKLSLRNSVKDVARMQYGYVDKDIEILTKKFARAPQGIEDYDFVHGYEDADGKLQPGALEWDKPLMEYVRRYPKDWLIVDKCLGLARNKSRHACGYVICDEPVSNFIPLMTMDGYTITQYTAPSVEAVGGVKMDFLGVNSLDDIAGAIKLIRESQGLPAEGDYTLDGKKVPWFQAIPFGDRLWDVWDLPQDQAVFRDICEGKTETVFQFNTESAKKWFREFNHVRYVDERGEVHKSLDTDESLAAFTALDRPGPLDYFVGGDGTEKNKGHNMLVEYARRASGQAPTGNMAVLDKLLPETMGVIVYQEQLQFIFQHVGQTTALQADAFRTHISKKQMEKVYKDKAIFMPGARKVMSEEEAEELWSSMETFGKYGFNKSHAVCYASKTGYACAWLKHYYPLQWWTSVLRNAEKNEVNEVFWPYCGKLVLMPDVVKSGRSYQVEGQHIRAPINLLSGIGVKAHEQLLEGFPYRDIMDFCEKVQAHRAKGGKVVTKEDKKTGAKKQVMKLGNTALHRGVVYTLILSGAMDSLFPEGATVLEQLNAYEQALSVTTKKRLDQKAIKEIYDRFGDISQLQRYQMKKAVLPIYSVDVVPMCLDQKVSGISERPHVDINGRESLHRYVDYKVYDREGFLEGTEVTLAAGRDFHLMTLDKDYPKGHVVAIAGYVKAARKFSYGQSEQGVKHALEVIIDVDGFDFKLVKWSGKSGRLDSKYTDQSLVGAILLAMATKFDPERPFAIEDIRVIQPPLNLSKEESSEEKPHGQENAQAAA